MEKKTSQDDIDVMALFLNGINIVRANFWLIICFFLLGSVLGVTHYYTAKKIYENRIIVSSSILTRSYAKLLIDNLNKRIRQNDVNTIAFQLQVSENIAGEIAYIAVENLIEADELKESDKYIISVEIFNENVLPNLQKGLIHYLENNDFVRVRVEQNKKYLQQVIRKLELEIKDMEDFKTRIFKGDFFANAKGNIMFDPTSFNSKIIELTKEKLTLQNTFDLANSVQIVEGFTKFGRPSKPKLSLSLISGSVVGLIFAGIIIAFKSIRKLLRRADAAKQRAV